MQAHLHRLEAAEKIFLVLMLFVLSGSLFPFNMDQYATGGREAIEAPGSEFFRYLIGGIYSVIGLLLLYHWKKASRAARACPWIICLLLFACLSVVWSTEPELTIRRGIALLGTSMVGIYLVSRFSLQDILRLLAASLGLVFFFSVVLILFFPEYGTNPAPHLGAWRGVFSQKQAAGIYFSLALLIFLGSALLEHGIRFWASILGVAASTYFVYRCDSKTALILMIVVAASVAFFAFFVRREYRTPRMWFVVVFLIINVIGWAGYATLTHHQSDRQQSDRTEAGIDSDGILRSLGRDSTLTGRTVIWSEIMRQATQRPIAGYGYVGFVWPPDMGAPYKQIRKVIHRKLNFYVSQSHNGYVHLFLALGGIGILLLVLALISIVKDGILCVVRNQLGYETMWGGVFLLWFLMANIASVSILSQNLIYWPFFILVAVRLRWVRLRGEPSMSSSAQQVESI